MRNIATITVALLGASTAGPALAQPTGTYRALGTEPFWSLTITRQRMTFEDSEGQRVSVPTPEPAYPRYIGRNYFSQRLRVNIRTTHNCSDGMSDRAYADEVEVVVDGRRLEGCGGAFTEPSRLANTNWRISAINGRRVPAAGPYRIDFTEDRLSAQAGCNRLGGSYRLQGDRLTAGPIMSTRMACVDLQGRPAPWEQIVLRILGEPLRVTQQGEHRMTLSNRRGTISLELVPGERPRR